MPGQDNHKIEFHIYNGIRMNIRIAQSSDSLDVAHLKLLFNGVDTPAEEYAARLSDPRRVDIPILAEVEGRVVGLVNLRLAPSVFYAEPYAEISELFVEEAYRRRGIGQALVQFAESQAKAAGANEMIILTDFYNHNAQMLYYHLGYEIHDLALSKELGQVGFS
jgi:GNAT superfamily N-acetyltransferase